MWLTEGNIHAHVTRATDAETEWLRSKASGLAFTDKRKLHTTGELELKRFYDLLDHTFPAGFLPTVAERAREAGFEVKIIDGRPPAAALVDADLSWLDEREHQPQAVAAALEKQRGILQVPTGGGKTEIAIGIVKRVPGKWLFLVHRNSLMEQAAARYELRCPGETSGRVGAKVWKSKGRRFTVATFQTLSARLRHPLKRAKVEMWLKQFDGIIVDECHVLPAESFKKVALACSNARWRIGISGTPLDREDQRSIYAVATLGPIIFKVGSTRLIMQKLLARPIIRMVEVHQDFDERDKEGLLVSWGWDKVYEEGVEKSRRRNKALTSMVRKCEKPALLFVKGIEHGQKLLELLRDPARHCKADFVWGKSSLPQRQAAARRLIRGDLDVLICSVIFQEGLDLPELRSVIVGSGGKSVIAALQRIGRGMRRADGKDTFEVWDVADTGNRWLTRHARRRRHAYQREGYSVSVVHLVAQATRPPEGPQGELPLAR